MLKIVHYFFMLISINIAIMKANYDFSTLKDNNPFNYDLGINSIPDKTNHNVVTICCHGYGHNNTIVNILNSWNVLEGALIGFNFPDYNITPEMDHTKCAYGTIHEILPLLYIIKCSAFDLKFSQINLYGFSAGAGAIINALAALNSTCFDDDLRKIGIFPEHKKQLLVLISHGCIILDCPLKSIQEIIDTRGNTTELEILRSTYNRNHMNPIDNLCMLADLKLNIWLHFQYNDEILGNRDDMLFIECCKMSNKGNTHVVFGSDGGHTTFHASLWESFKNKGE